ncbi:hypothetical protein MMC13_001032 [Lambiella insularis]|nr:hypothetical protein [Lambiella insularis]
MARPSIFSRNRYPLLVSAAVLAAASTSYVRFQRERARPTVASDGAEWARDGKEMGGGTSTGQYAVQIHRSGE